MWNFSRGISRTVADRKPIRWAVPRGAEGYMGLAQYFLTHEENMRQSFSQPSRRARRTLPDGTCIDYIMNDVVDCIMISRPQIQARGLGKEMTWDKLPPFLTGTTTIDLSSMTADPDVSGGYYCTVSVINGTDENGRKLSAEFSVDTEDSGWSIERIDGRSARLKLGADVEGECDIVAKDGKTTLRKKVGAVAVDDVFFIMDGKVYDLQLNLLSNSYTDIGTEITDYAGLEGGELNEYQEDVPGGARDWGDASLLEYSTSWDVTMIVFPEFEYTASGARPLEADGNLYEFIVGHYYDSKYAVVDFCYDDFTVRVNHPEGQKAYANGTIDLDYSVRFAPHDDDVLVYMHLRNVSDYYVLVGSSAGLHDIVAASDTSIGGFYTGTQY